MPTCRYCGRAIEFRYADGVCTPIHLHGGWCDGYAGRSGSSGGGGGDTRIYRYSGEDFCRETRCPKCKASVYFVRHNGGSVWFDSLGWPWPKHGCFEDRTGDALFDGFRKLVISADPSRPFALVARLKTDGDRHASYTLLALECPEARGACVSLRGTHPDLLGHLLLPHFDPTGTEVKQLSTSAGLELPLLNGHLDPTSLGLPKGWCPTKAKPAGASGPPPANPTPGGKRKPSLGTPLPSKAHTLVRCPLCKGLVRQDRMPRHMRRAHAGR